MSNRKGGGNNKNKNPVGDDLFCVFLFLFYVMMMTLLYHPPAVVLFNINAHSSLHFMGKIVIILDYLSIFFPHRRINVIRVGRA